MYKINKIRKTKEQIVANNLTGNYSLSFPKN